MILCPIRHGAAGCEPGQYNISLIQTSKGYYLVLPQMLPLLYVHYIAMYMYVQTRVRTSRNTVCICLAWLPWQKGLYTAHVDRIPTRIHTTNRLHGFQTGGGGSSLIAKPRDCMGTLLLLSIA